MRAFLVLLVSIGGICFHSFAMESIIYSANIKNIVKEESLLKLLTADKLSDYTGRIESIHLRPGKELRVSVDFAELTLTGLKHAQYTDANIENNWPYDALKRYTR